MTRSASVALVQIRYAHVGSGNIGMQAMYEIAQRCDAAGLPMIIE
jgi:hypothetical protein